MYDLEAEKLSLKNGLEQLRWDLENRFGFSEILIEVLMKRFQQFLEESGNIDEEGRILYWGTAASEPSGKTQKEMEKVRIHLTLSHPDDIKVLKESGIGAVRKKRIMRITNEAKEQNTFLTQEDLALLLCNSPRTIRYDIKQIRDEGIEVPTRGQMKDIGRGVSHKAKVVLEYLKGYTYPEIRIRTHHSDESIERYIRDFSRVIYLHERKEPVIRIRQVTRLSETLVGEYLQIYSEYSDTECPRLKEILDKTPLKKVHIGNKGGGP